jgi:hypothetical protein
MKNEVVSSGPAEMAFRRKSGILIKIAGIELIYGLAAPISVEP